MKILRNQTSISKIGDACIMVLMTLKRTKQPSLKKKLLLIFIGMLSFNCTLIAQDYFSLYANNMKDSKSWKIEEVRKIAFSSDEVSVHLYQSDNPYSLGYDNVRKFVFENEAIPDVSNINKVETLTPNLKYDASRRCLYVNSPLLGNSKLQIFNVSGVKVFYSNVVEQHSEYFLDNLTSGIYIVKFTDGNTTKSLKLQIK